MGCTKLTVQVIPHNCKLLLCVQNFTDYIILQSSVLSNNRGAHTPCPPVIPPPPLLTPRYPSISVSYVDYASVCSMQLSRLTTSSSNSLVGVLSSFCKVAMLNLSSLPVFLNRKQYRETGSWSVCSRSYKKKERKSNNESATKSCPKRSARG